MVHSPCQGVLSLKRETTPILGKRNYPVQHDNWWSELAPSPHRRLYGSPLIGEIREVQARREAGLDPPSAHRAARIWTS